MRPCAGRRWSLVVTVMTCVVVAVTGCGDGGDDAVDSGEAAASSEPGGVPVSQSNGRIVFARHDSALDGHMTYTVNPDGSDLRPLFTDEPSELPRWSPDSSEIQIFCCDDGMAAHLVDPDGEGFRTLASTDDALETHCGFAWSPDGERLACENFGVDDPNLNGIYSVRATDGGDLTRITSIPDGDDLPGDYSPDGRQLVFMRLEAGGKVGIFVSNLDGTGLRQISGPDQLIDETFGGSWSPDGSQILFVARETPNHHKAIWVVHPDGSSLHQLQIDRACGGPLRDPEFVGCYSPGWSPDGTKIVLTGSEPDGVQAEPLHGQCGRDRTPPADGRRCRRLRRLGDTPDDVKPNPRAERNAA